MSKLKDSSGFISYRNTEAGGEFVNYNIVRTLSEYLHWNTGKIFDTLQPEVIPRQALFTPYDVAHFVNQTFRILDSRDHFVILDADYWDSNGRFTSIWTEAECCIWSYYDRAMPFSRWKRKDNFFHIAELDNSRASFVFGKRRLLNLSARAQSLLQAASMDFEGGLHGGGSNVQRFYGKHSRKYLVSCYKCSKTIMISRERLSDMADRCVAYKCQCTSNLSICRSGRYFTASQGGQRPHAMFSVFDAIAILFSSNPPFGIIE